MSPTVEGRGRSLDPYWPLGPFLGEWEGEQVWVLGVHGDTCL